MGESLWFLNFEVSTDCNQIVKSCTEKEEDFKRLYGPATFDFAPAPTVKHTSSERRENLASAEGAKYDSQGQVRSEAEHVAPGSTIQQSAQA